MKKHYPLMILFVALQTYALGQDTSDGRRWHFGVMAGPNFTIFVPKTEGFEAKRLVFTLAAQFYNIQKLD
jgi:hypothetical protein